MGNSQQKEKLEEQKAVVEYSCRYNQRKSAARKAAAEKEITEKAAPSHL